jgi:5-methylcytosine-specific restriction endonuclease McrA
MKHRAEAQRHEGLTDAQQAALALGRQPGQNGRTGYKHSDATKAKIRATNRRYWRDHPDEALARGAKLRGARHYQWKGGQAKLTASLRLMTEHRKWMDAVKARDGKCVRCGSIEKLESHHVEPMATLIKRLGIASREDARSHAAALWDVSNGLTLCEQCHYEEHGRKVDQRRRDARKRKRLQQIAA